MYLTYSHGSIIDYGNLNISIIFAAQFLGSAFSSADHESL